jgi:hypothetical protein
LNIDEKRMRRRLRRTRPSIALFATALLILISGCPASRRSAREPPAGDASHDASAIKHTAATDAGGAGAPRSDVSAEMDAVLASYAYGRRTRRDPTDLCEPVRENLDRAARAILADRNGTPPGARATPWDKVTPPMYMDIVDHRFALTTAEKRALAKNGFVVSPRLTQRSYAEAFHEIYRSQLPIYVSADAILHSVFKSNDVVLENVEMDLAPRLDALLGKMHGALAAAAGAYPPEIAGDVDLYLTVARSLLAEETARSALGADAAAAPFIKSAREGSGGLANVTLFGRRRMVDFSQYTPRGHYAKSEPLQRYFRSSMWLSRLEMNLVSRASRSSEPGIVPNPDETPREAVVALAIADLAERAGVLDDLDVFDSTWAHFAGKREDVSIRALLALRAKAGITKLEVPDSAERLKAAIGAGFARTTRVHYMPQGSTPLPAIATMLGPRIVADAQAETSLVHARVANRSMPSFADVAFMLGHDRAKTWLASDLSAFPALAGELDAGRALLDATPPTDMYAAWLGAIRGLSAPALGVAPSYMKTTAFADLRVNGTVAAYGQLRHNYVLLAGQAYDEGGCEVPDGFVEPALAVYEGLVGYAHRGSEAMTRIGAPTSSAEYFARLETTMRVLVEMTKHELAGRALSEEEKRWLSMVVEIVPPSSDGPGSQDGWYFDLFPNTGDAFSDHAFVADWFTSSNANAVVYAGATAPRLGLFVVDTGGEPRVMAGPVARAFELVGKLDTRLKDADVAQLKGLREPWSASYSPPVPADPPLAVLGLTGTAYALRSNRALGPVTLEMLDHHRTKVGSKTAFVGPGWTKFDIPTKNDEFAEVVRVRFGDFSREISTLYGAANDAFGGMKPVPDDVVYPLREKLHPPE